MKTAKQIIIILLLSWGYSVGEPGAMFLTYSPGAFNNGIGEAGTGFASYDAYAAYYNPGAFTPQKSFEFHYSTYDTDWLSNSMSGIKLGYESQIISCQVSQKHDIYVSFINLVTTLKYPSGYNQLNGKSTGQTYAFGYRAYKVPINIVTMDA